MRPAMTRVEFLAKRRRILTNRGLEERYGCPYHALRNWADYLVPWGEQTITLARSRSHEPFWAKYLTDIKAANAGIARLAKEYEKAIAPLGRAAT